MENLQFSEPIETYMFLCMCPRRTDCVRTLDGTGKVQNLGRAIRLTDVVVVGDKVTQKRRKLHIGRTVTVEFNKHPSQRPARPEWAARRTVSYMQWSTVRCHAAETSVVVAKGNGTLDF